MRGAHWRVAAAVVVTAALSACVNGPGGCDFDPCPPGKGSVAALDAKGAERWRTSISDRSDDPPAVSGNYVIVDGCRAVHVLDAATGRLLVSTEELADGVGVAGGLVWGAEATEDGEAGRAVKGVPLEGKGGRSIEHLGGSNGESGDFARTFTVSGDYLVGTHGDVLSVDPATEGPDRWVQLPVRPTQRVLVLGNDRAVTASPDGSVVGVDTATMRLAWRVVPEAVSRSYAVRLKAVGDTVVVTALGQSAEEGVAEAFAVSARDGRVLWRRQGWELAAAEGAVAVLVSPRAVAGVDLATGRELWTRRVGPGYVDSYPDAQLLTRAGTIAVSAGVVALPARDVRGQQDILIGADARTGRELWRVDGERQPVGLGDSFGVTAWDERRAQDSRAWLAALDPRTGKQVWTTQLRADRFSYARPAAQLAADPARSQTLLLDLPQLPHGGCF